MCPQISLDANHGNSVHSGISPKSSAEVPDAILTQAMQEPVIHPLQESVAQTPNFGDSDADDGFRFSTDQIKCPVVIEIFCGSARITACMKTIGFHASFGIDHKLDKATSSAKKLDLTDVEQQRLLFQWLKSPLVVGVWLAPPCGTCSLARNIQLRDQHGRPMRGPRPLRSTVSPEGLTGLTTVERARVSAANKLYELVAQVVHFAHDNKLLVVVENPRSSLFWLTKFWKSVGHIMKYTAHQACAYGGSRPKWTVLAWNHSAFASISRTCPGESPYHRHKPWGVVQSTEGRHFSTSEETAYPKPLAMAIARVFAMILIQHGWDPPNESFEAATGSDLKVLRAVATAQPRAAKIPPVVREHERVIVIKGPFYALAQAPISAMERLKQPWTVPSSCTSIMSVLPSGAQLLRTTPLRSNGEILKITQENAAEAEQAWGIPFSPEMFIEEAVKRGHPKAFSKLMPEILERAIWENFGQGSDASRLALDRASWFQRWTHRARELASQEEELKNRLPEHLKRILAPKRLMLWKEILAEIKYPDMEVFDELVNGTDLVGEVLPCGVFEKKFKQAELTVKQLQAMSKKERRANFYKCCSSGDPEVDQVVYDKTMEEVTFGWANGPLQLDEVPDSAVLSRRFGLKQPGKIRLIDDLSGSQVNSTVQTSESPKPQNLDFIGALLLQILQTGCFPELLGRTFDVKSAYKQMGIALESLRFAYVVVFNPVKREPEVFQLLAAPFGATRSVYSFLRVIHSVWYIGVTALHLTWSHFFDDFVVISEKSLANNTERSVELLFKLLGWKFAEEGDKAGAFSETFTALGVEVQLQQAPMGQVEFANTLKRKTELVETISMHLKTGKMSVVEAQKLRGRMQFMEGQIFGRLGRLCMRAITEHAFIHRSIVLGEVTLEARRRFLIFLEHSKPRRVHLCSGDSWYIFTDACFEPGNEDWTCGLGGVLVEPSGKPASFFSCCLSGDQMQCLGASSKKTIIFEAELLALVLAFAVWRNKLEGAPVVCFIDNNSARDVAISGQDGGY